MVELGVVRQRWRVHVGDVPVHVPFDVINTRGVNDVTDLLDNVVLHGWLSQIQHQLMAAQDWRPAGHMHRPLRVRPVEVAVFVNHFRLKPQADFQP